MVHNTLTFRRGHLHITTIDRHLIEVRQARSLASLSTNALDEEITYRVLREWDSWGWLGTLIHDSQWSRSTTCFCEAVSCGTRELGP
ncbi:hypothetical protein GQ44DRAFT_713751 [Phaeosphaeriaceae sp. PMI808]|nr:hypothetical protein GQ44DRAFT_713751 [Phaeosphaeriaceae sp. PMI808]